MKGRPSALTERITSARLATQQTSAVCVNIMCEMWTDDAAPGVGPMGNPLAKGHLDTQARSWAEYGMTTGGYRLLDVVGRYGYPMRDIRERHYYGKIP